MESFLASRPTVAKLGSSVKNFTGSVFTPMSVAAPGSPKTVAVSQPGIATVESSATESTSQPESAHAAHPVRVEVIQENGVVGKIIVHCQCGETIELDCLYPD